MSTFPIASLSCSTSLITNTVNVDNSLTLNPIQSQPPVTSPSENPVHGKDELIPLILGRSGLWSP